jgi:hypothetical protein
MLSVVTLGVILANVVAPTAHLFIILCVTTNENTDQKFFSSKFKKNQLWKGESVSRPSPTMRTFYLSAFCIWLFTSAVKGQKLTGSGKDYLQQTEQGPWFTGSCK